MGVPVIARRCSGNESILTHKKTGLLFDTSEEFVDLATELINDEKLKQQLILDGKEYIGNNFNGDNEKEAYCKLFEEVLG